MKDVFVARQPIYDTDLSVVAYELLFREEESTNWADINDADQATHRVLINTFADIGLDTVTGHLPAFVNLSRTMIIQPNPPPFPSDKIVIELLEDQLYDEHLLAGIQRLKAHHFQVALDDFFFEEEFAPLVALADIVKLDVLALSDAELLDHVNRLKKYNVKLLAEKVETHDMFTRCKALGFCLFQGYFFCKPKIIKGTRKHLEKNELFELLCDLQGPHTLASLQTLFESKTRFIYKLCLTVNALHAERTSVNSFTDLYQHYSIAEIIKWAHVIALYNVKNKPKELFIMASERAHMCARFSDILHYKHTYDVFLLGLLSVADAIFDKPMNAITQQLKLPQEVCQALNEQQGPLGELLRVIIAYEHGEFDPVSAQHISADKCSEYYLEALAFAEKLTDTLYLRSKQRKSSYKE